MKKKPRTNTIILIVIAIFLAVSAYQLAVLPTKDTSNKNVEEEILAKLNLNKENTQITKLTNLEELKEKYPVIYGEAREGDYEIRNTNKLIIYDYANDRIIKEFDVTNIRIGA